MFKVYCDNELIHHSQAPSPEVKLIDPKLTLEENTSGTFTFKCPTQNVGYTMIETLNSIVRVERDDVTLFNGRVINEKQDFYGTKEITVEGDLGYLNDTVQPQRKYQNRTISGFLTEIISVHNTRGGASKSFSIGYVDNTMDPEGFSDYITNYETTMECIRKNILEKYGGHIIVRYSNDKIYLDYRDNYPNTNSQKIEFGKNLLEFTKNFEVDDICTVLLPLGKKLEESDIEDVDAYTTIAKVTVPESGNNIYTPTNSIYVYNKEAMNTFGLIERCVKWSDIEETDEWPSQGTSNIMYRKAKRYLEDSQFSKLTIELSAVDLHYMNVDYTAINLYDTLLCTSKPHGMINAQFPVKKMEISLDKPEDTKFTIGDTVMSGTLTSSVNKENEAVIRAIEDMPSESSILEEAKKNAAEALRQNLTGYVNITTSEYQGIHSEAIYISDTKLPPEVVDTNDSPLPNNDIKKLASKYWKWDLNGLSYWEKGTSSTAHQLGLALTMDGSIVADMITTGTLNVAGNLTIAGKIQDANGHNYWDLDNGVFMMGGNWTEINTTGLEIVFDGRSKTETADICTIYYKDYREENSPWYYIQKRGSTYWDSINIPAKGNIYIYWYSDYSVHNYWGFKIKSLNYYFGNSYTTYTSWVSSLPSTSGYTIRSLNMKLANTIETAHEYTDNEKIRWTVVYNKCTVDANTQQTAAMDSSEKVDDYDIFLNQEKVFNKLTNNGTTQCITRDSSGNLYINATYINTGTLTVGNTLVIDGTIRDRNNRNYWNLTNGNFSLSSSYAKIDDSSIASESYAVDVANAAASTLDSSLNQTKIFNKLTNNGAAKGIFLTSKQLYINADYISTGIIKSSNNTMLIDLDNNSITSNLFTLSSTYINIDNSNGITVKGNLQRSDLVEYYSKTTLNSGGLKIDCSSTIDGAYYNLGYIFGDYENDTITVSTPYSILLKGGMGTTYSDKPHLLINQAKSSNTEIELYGSQRSSGQLSRVAIGKNFTTIEGHELNLVYDYLNIGNKSCGFYNVVNGINLWNQSCIGQIYFNHVTNICRNLSIWGDGQGGINWSFDNYTTDIAYAKDDATVTGINSITYREALVNTSS